MAEALYIILTALLVSLAFSVGGFPSALVVLAAMILLALILTKEGDM